jgi:hypothetical protein
MMMNWKRFGKKRLWPNFKVLYRHSLEEPRKTKIILNQDIRSRDFNPESPEYETGVLTTRPRRSVMGTVIFFYFTFYIIITISKVVPHQKLKYFGNLLPCNYNFRTLYYVALMLAPPQKSCLHISL